MINFILYYLVAPFFVCDGIYVIVRSFIALKKHEFENVQYPMATKNWNLASIAVGLIAIIMGVLILFRVFTI